MANIQTKRLVYGEAKKPTTFILTPTAKALVIEVADNLSISSSEALERIIRYLAPKLIDGEVSLED